MADKRGKYDIELIKEMRLEGKSLKEIAEYYNVKKSTLSEFLKRKGIIFSKLPVKCKYCGKIFIPKDQRNKFCCKEHAKYYNYINTNHRINDLGKIYKKKRDYKQACNTLIELKYYAEKKGCSWCNEHDFDIADGEVYCKKCGLVFEL